MPSHNHYRCVRCGLSSFFLDARHVCRACRDKEYAAPDLDKGDTMLIHGRQFFLLPLIALIVSLVLSAAPAQASKWQGWDSWCLTHHRHHQAMCR